MHCVNGQGGVCVWIGVVCEWIEVVYVCRQEWCGYLCNV